MTGAPYDGPVSSSSPFGGSNPFEHLLGDLIKLISNAGPMQWDLARQLAHAVATDGQPETNVEPVDRIRLEELIRVADLHVSTLTGLPTSTTGHLVTVRPVTRSEWAWRALEAWRPLIESLATSITRPPGGRAPGGGQGGQEPPGGPLPGSEHPTAGPAGLDEQKWPGEFLPEPGEAGDSGGDAGLMGLLGNLGQAIGPAMLGLQVGSAIGHLARRAMGPYVLPVPWPPGDELLLVPANISSFTTDWSLPGDEVRLWVCLSELTHHAVIGRPHVRHRLNQLINDYVGGFRIDPSALESRLSGVDPTDPASLQAALGDPTALLGELQTPEQRRVLGQLGAVVMALEGYVDHVMDSVGHQLIGSYPALTEALRRRRVERDGGERMVEQLFGLELSQARFDRGTAFIRGVVERAGEDALARLWQSDATLPTPAEIDAPGLWLARIELLDQPDPEG